MNDRQIGREIDKAKEMKGTQEYRKKQNEPAQRSGASIVICTAGRQMLVCQSRAQAACEEVCERNQDIHL
jgi:hypothetical protein